MTSYPSHLNNLERLALASSQFSPDNLPAFACGLWRINEELRVNVIQRPLHFSDWLFGSLFIYSRPTWYGSFHYKLDQMLAKHTNSSVLKGHVTLSKTKENGQRPFVTDSGNYSNVDAY